MAATQHGTGSLTASGAAAKAATYITVPAGSIIESVSVSNGGSPIYDDLMDEDGAFHTRITFEASMHQATVVVVGKAFAAAAGTLDGSGSDHYIESATEETSKGPVRTTVTVTNLPTVS
jgi:hypothetical protein|tara:strand:+ start:792 stop:1148 length:357 start_codon:yes stop_codon:yes gene_type:complete